MPDLPEPSVEIGLQLRQFFTNLFDDTNMLEYAKSRDDYIGRTLGEESDAARVLREGTLGLIEDISKL